MDKKQIIEVIKQERQSYIAAIYGFVIGFLFSMLFWASQDWLAIDIVSPFYALILILSFLIPLVFIPVRYNKKGKTNLKTISESVVLALSYSLLVGFIGILFVKLLSAMFFGITYGYLTTISMAGLYAAIIIYYLNLRIANLGIKNIAELILFTMIGGVSVSAIFNSNPLWWQESVSYLGMETSNANIFINIGLALASALLILLSRLVFLEFDRLRKNGLITEKKLKIAKGVYLYSSVALGMIGLFSYGRSDFSTLIHNLSAFTMFPLLILCMLFIYKFMDNFGKGFRSISVFGGLLIILIYLMFVAEKASLAIMEMSAILIITIWAYIFLKNVYLLNIVKENNIDLNKDI
jgi:hypothetical protein